jgi:tRNA A37 threonylcarbamoyladenosine biosynthesis protein TsaE
MSTGTCESNLQKIAMNTERTKEILTNIEKLVAQQNVILLSSYELNGGDSVALKGIAEALGVTVTLSNND